MANTKVTSRVLANDAVLTANIADDQVTTAKIADDQITSALVADDLALGGNPTTTTQSAGNNTTRIATTAFVSTAVSNLVDSSPSALNTLNELAAALGDDANFSTTITNSIATKLPLAGGTMTGNIIMGDDTSIGIADDAERIEFDGAGDISLLGANVGIGTTSPAQKLEVYNSATDSQSYVKIQNNRARNAAVNFVTTAANWYVGAGIGTDTDVFQIYDGDVGTRLLINSSGNVGIGTSSPSSIFHVVAEGNNGQRVHVGTSSAHQIYLGNTGGVSSVGTLSNHNFQIITNGSSRAVVDTSGNVGIGTTSPSGLLTIEGDTNSDTFEHLTLKSTVNLNPSKVNMFFESGQGKLAKLEGRQIAGGPNAYGDMIFHTSNNGTMSEKMRIMYNGSVGIGNTIPSSFFAGASSLVAGDGSGDDGITIYSGNASLGRIHFADGTSGADVYAGFIAYNHADNDMLLGGRGSGTTIMTLEANGSVGAPSGTNIYNASDRRVKQNITTLSDSLTIVKALNPVKFNWIEDFSKSENDKTLYGFVAQEVQTVFPDAVESFASGQPIKAGDVTVDNPLAVREKFLIPVLVKAMQEQQEQIETLKKEVEELKGG